MKFKNTAKLVKAKRAALGLAQKELAEKIGVNGQYISNIERGLSGIPVTRAKKLAKALNTPMKEIADVAAEDYLIRYLDSSL